MTYTLLHGDCLERMKEIETGTVDMILCDLPYGTTCCSWDSIIPFEPLWTEYERIIKDNGAIILFSAQPFTAVLATSNLKLFRYEWIWEKPAATGFMNAKKQPLRAHENILVFYKSQPTYNPQKTFGHERKTAKRKDIGSEHYGKQLKIQPYDSTERYPRSEPISLRFAVNRYVHMKTFLCSTSHSQHTTHRKPLGMSVRQQSAKILVLNITESN